MSRFEIEAAMRILFIILALCAFSLNSNAEMVNSKDYDYPVHNPLRASIASQLGLRQKWNYKTETIVTVKNREMLSGFQKEDSDVPFSYSLNPKVAPVLFVIPGLGSSGDDRMAMKIGSLFYKRGYNVIVIGNPFTWKFALGGSPSGLPGYFPRDAKDLYEHMRRVDFYLRTSHNMRPSSYSMLGYSLGGGLVPFLLKEDRRQNSFHFRKVVSLNPPVDFRRAMRTIDSFCGVQIKWKELKKGNLFVQGLRLATEMFSLRNDRRGSVAAFNDVDVPDDLLKWLIGGVFKKNLTNIVYASQQVNDEGFLKSPSIKFMKDERYQEAKKITFEGYAEKLVIPDLRKGSFRGTTDSFYASTDIRSLKDFIRQDSAAYLIHNTDDFLMKADVDIPWIKEAYGNRWTVYPSGGHLGNFWHPLVQKKLLEIIDAH